MSARRLFPDTGKDLQAFLQAFSDHLQAVAPLKGKHRAVLHKGVAELSDLLTVHRDELPPDYMARPPLLAAYLHFFLPWNLVRQGRLLQGLGDLPAPGPSLRILDLGAGPATFLLALWLARPELRAREVAYTAVDRTEAPVRVGFDLFRRLAPDSPWSLHFRPAGAGRRSPGPDRAADERADLLVAANVLNEMPAGGGRQGGGRSGGDDEEARAEAMLATWEKSVDSGGRVLVIEPGMRDAGRQLSRMRGQALARGWSVLAPCPHQGECPLPGTGRKAWCHFAFEAGGIPAWLDGLGRKAGLPKQRASLSFLLMGRRENTTGGEGGPGDLELRVTSDAIELPERRRGVYACSARGLALLELGDVPTPRQGDLVKVRVPDHPRRDKKSGALVIGAPETNPPGVPRSRKR
ncbi:ribosomal methyltransferase [bacterium]|nr:ribosomal methyltransferase [bacterium]